MKLCPSCKNGLVGSPTKCTICSEDLVAVADCTDENLVGMVIDGKYELLKLLGAGSMGCVYKSVHRGLDRPVAIKLMRNVGIMEKHWTIRFEREARAASRLNHPHVVSMVDFGRTEGGILYLITEFVDGESLYELLKRELMPLDQVFTIFNQVLAAIDEAHSARVIHRDLKPENIIITSLRSGESFVKVVDFGIAMLPDDTNPRVTRSGTCVGTPGYMAPEHIAGEEATECSDIYALGVILYEMIVGHGPFEHEIATVVLTKQLTEDPIPMSKVSPRPELNTEIEQVVNRAIARDPKDRFASIPEFGDALMAAVSKMNIDRNPQRYSMVPPANVLGLQQPAFEPAYGEPAEMAKDRISAFPTQESPTIGPNYEDIQKTVVPPEIVGWSAVAKRVVDFLRGDDPLLDVVGQEGSGKSSLADGIAHAAERLGMIFYRTGPDPWLSRTPWYPVRNIVGQILGCGPAPYTTRQLLDAVRKSQLDEHTDGAPLAALFGFSPNIENTKDQLQRATIKALELGVANDTGICFILEDAHEFDRASARFLQTVAQNSDPDAIKIVATSETGLISSDSKSKLRLPFMSIESVETMVKRHVAVDGEDSKKLVRKIAELSAGNPLHVVQAARSVHEGNQIFGTLTDVIEGRLSNLTLETRWVFEAICALGTSVTTEMLDELLDDDQLFLALQRLLSSGWIKVGTGKTVAPAHKSIARIVRDLMKSDQRKKLHGQILALFKKRSVPVFVLAHHAWEAKHHEEAMALLERAGDEACAWFDEEQAALDYYKRALHLARWELLLGPEDHDYLELQLKLGQSLFRSGHRITAKVVLKEILGSSRQFSDISQKARDALATL